MKVLFVLAAILLQTAAVVAQSTVNDFFVKSQTTITKTSADGYYSRFVTATVLPRGVQVAAGSSFTLHTLNNSNYKLLEVPVTSASNGVNLMFVAIDVRNDTGRVFFKSHAAGHYEFFDQNLVKLYSLDIVGNDVRFVNQPGTGERSNCYSKCRAAAYAAIEGDFLSDFACQINPCGIAIALFCGAQCG
ncbi:MAG TPA: hypothetical protein VF676_07310 [Flavobacterium sp.]|jgi:hypothetical protein